ncbi:MAG: hypothetical protein MUD05_06655 [Candidatus Nanopelagicales bacterium]|nr:hypothetical protein [Candidatus Nanopelagicales bacterium]
MTAATPHATLLVTVEQRRTQALMRMEAEVGSKSLCTISRAGLSVPALKYDEGAASALADLRRVLLNTADDADESDLLAAIAGVRDAWRHSPAHRLAQSNEEWNAYATGGEDALSSLLDAASW